MEDMQRANEFPDLNGVLIIFIILISPLNSLHLFNEDGNALYLSVNIAVVPFAPMRCFSKTHRHMRPGGDQVKLTEGLAEAAARRDLELQNWIFGN